MKIPKLMMGKYWWIPATVCVQATLAWLALAVDEPSLRAIDLVLSIPLTIGAIILIIMTVNGEIELRK